MHVDVSDFLIWLIAGAIGWAARHAKELLEWRRVRRLAKRELESDEGTDNPEQAMANALVTEQMPRLKRESISIVLNGTGPHRKL